MSCIYKVAVPVPVFRPLEYLGPEPPPPPGVRLRVPLGRREAVGVLVATATESSLPAQRLKRVLRVLDEEPLLPPPSISLLAWAADYYHHPIGEVMAVALPLWLRQGRAARASGVRIWRLTAAGRAADSGSLARAPAQRRLFEAFRQAHDGLDEEALARLSERFRPALRALEARGWVEVSERDCLPAATRSIRPGPALSAAQAAAVEAIAAHFGHYQACLLYGVTGSGKTEVYLRLIERAIGAGRQALVLVPEIGLTPQLLARFRERLGVPIAVLHSALPERERLCAWLAARAGRAAVVIGTRSACFVPLARPGLIVVDEEHDPSYKQQEGFRYHARDVAVMRAAREQIPIVLGSATPSLESLHQARRQRYAWFRLPERTGSARMPTVRLLDMRALKASEGLSAPLREAIAARLARREQALLFLNRRGFAPALMCHACGWVAPCQRCDAELTLHRARGRLLCHHCGAEQLIPERCPQCGGERLLPLGQGTERIEAALARFFPEARIVRIDRDTTRRQGALEAALAQAASGEADILVGTQILSKGHDFPNVTLVGVVNADQGLYSVDFRAPERLFQQILQVAGRAGRADKPGEVLIQTWHPTHPLFAALARQDYETFAEYALAERREADYPPWTHLALLRAESPERGAALAFLEAARSLAAEPAPPPEAVRLIGPVPAPMERRAGRWRAQLLIESAARRPLHTFLADWLPRVAESKAARRVRWSLDVDPVDLY